MTYYKHSNLRKLGQGLALELFWLKAELIRIYSNNTNRCERCGAHSAPRKALQLHHRLHDGDAAREQWAMNTKTPHVMGYYYQMLFEYQKDPVAAKARYGVLCPRCNRVDHVAREAVARGNNEMQALVVDKPLYVPEVEREDEYEVPEVEE